MLNTSIDGRFDLLDAEADFMMTTLIRRELLDNLMIFRFAAAVFIMLLLVVVTTAVKKLLTMFVVVLLSGAYLAFVRVEV